MPRVLLPHPRAELVRFYGMTVIDGLSALAEVRLNDLDRHFSRDELIAAAEGCDIIMSFGVTPGEAELFEALPDLTAFMRWAVDYRNIDVAAASRHGILVTNGLAGFEAGVSELIIGLMLSLARRISESDASYHRGVVPPAMLGPELRGGTLGIIGFGKIGRYLADLALAFGMRVIVTDPYATIGDRAIRQVAMDELLATSDHVVCLATATPETENLMCAAAFGKMKPSAFFINLSRGNLVNEDDLVAALDGGTIAGCALDVGRAPRQMPTPAVAAHPKVVASPHIGGLTPQAVEFQSLRVVEQAQAILAGEVPDRAINAAAAIRFRQRVSR